tara:strand:- start:176 stop:2704 length:2529 start_codon:yes stop_codon:yes gene_type:complete
MKKYILTLLLGVLGSFLMAQVQPPDEFFPHKRGEHFTPHHQLVNYYKHVAENSDMVTTRQYGTTNQGRPLILAFVSNKENIENLSDIQADNMKMAGEDSGDLTSNDPPALVWISCSVHGNEAAGSEAAPNILWELVNPDNSNSKEWLKNTVVIIDPSINPDGYSRYTNWVRDIAGDAVNTDLNDTEHQEPWPGGRVNHYLFDLNRDWAWQTQVESQQRMKVYNEWLPQVHVDLHEMGQESPYYFAPAAKPYHEYITKWQRDFQTTIGKNHAKYFDKEGWLYFTKEVFDLLYPSYGDTYPVFNGAIGMTYEQGGSSRGGRAVKTENGEILSLSDRIAHHTTTSLSTIEVSSKNAEALVSNYKDFWTKSFNNPRGKYKSFLIQKDVTGNRLKALCELLDKQNIKYSEVTNSKKISGTSYYTRENGSINAKSGDILVSAYQPKSVLTQVLFDPETMVEDSVTYDITAWSLPYAYGLNGIASTSKINPTKVRPSFNKTELADNDNAYAYIINWSDLEAPKALAALQKEKIDARINAKAFQLNGKKYAPGNVIITKMDNRSLGDSFHDKMEIVAKSSDAVIDVVKTGFAEAGPDLGSNSVDLIKAPKVLAIKGDGIRSLDFGQVRWYFDKVMDYPLTVVDIHRLSRTDISKYNTLILPSGRYNLSDGVMTKIGSWVSNGGRVIAIGNANRMFADKKGYALKSYAEDKDKTEVEKQSKSEKLAGRYLDHGGDQRRFISNIVPGAIFKLNMDNTHPLGSGLGKSYYSLRSSNLFYPLMTGADNAAYISKDPQIVGFAGSRIKAKLKDTVVFASQSKGKGKVIYMVDNPLFRGFWYNGLFVFSNAVFLDW